MGRGSHQSRFQLLDCLHIISMRRGFPGGPTPEARAASLGQFMAEACFAAHEELQRKQLSRGCRQGHPGDWRVRAGRTVMPLVHPGVPVDKLGTDRRQAR